MKCRRPFIIWLLLIAFGALLSENLFDLRHEDQPCGTFAHVHQSGPVASSAVKNADPEDGHGHASTCHGDQTLTGAFILLTPSVAVILPSLANGEFPVIRTFLYQDAELGSLRMPPKLS